MRGVGHVVGEILDRAVDAFGEQHRHVVGRLHHHHLERVVDGDLRARRKAHLGRRLHRRIGRHREQRVERDAVLASARCSVRYSVISLVSGRRIPRIGRVLGAQHFAGIGLDQNRRAGARRYGRAIAPTVAPNAGTRAMAEQPAPGKISYDARVAVRSVGRARVSRALGRGPRRFTKGSREAQLARNYVNPRRARRQSRIALSSD